MVNGAMFKMEDVMICMEVMDLSLDKFYVRAFSSNKPIPEYVLGNVAYPVMSALAYLQSKLAMIHRDANFSDIFFKIYSGYL